MKQRLLPYLLLGFVVCLGTAIFFPLPNRSPHNARRSSCQSNLKQIGLAWLQYAQDHDERLPPGHWATAISPYLRGAKPDDVFYCPETPYTSGTSDYFWNRRFSGKQQILISRPETLILLGDGQDNAPLDATLGSLPKTWRRDENSPAWRHLGTANYAFADGHVKSLKANWVTSYLRMGAAK